MTTTKARTRARALDAAAGAAVDLARAGAEDVGGETSVGVHLGAVAEGDRVVTHLFAAAVPGYRDWQWAVTVVRASRSREVTVSETVLVPTPDALVAPEWVPWSERIEPGDVGVGDLLPTNADDPRLEPGYGPIAGPGTPVDEDTDEDLVALVAYELGLGRERVLSPYGRDDAATRWYEGFAGPEAPVAQAAPGRCATCAFVVALGGPLRAVFGVCANAWSPSDGRVVSYDHGCGAHSEAALGPESTSAGTTVIDTMSFDTMNFEPLVVDEGVADS